MAKNQDLTEIIDLVGDVMHETAEYGLQIEVMASAMQMLRDNPGMDISIALQHGLNEWDVFKNM